MDSQLFRLNQMSYQHHSQHLHLQQQQQQQQRAAASRQHYSNRQQGRISPQQQQVKQQVAPVGGNGAGAASATNSSLASSGSDQDDQVHLSSLSTATNKTLGSANSQAAILGHNNPTTHMTAKQQQQHHLNSKRQQEAQMQREHQMAAMMGAGGGGGVGKHRQHHHQVAAGAQHNRQAALQAHTLTAPGSHHKQHQQDRMMAKMSSSDQLTTSSDQTIDDLHQLAPHHHFGSSGGGGGGPRQALRYDASQSSGGGGGSLAVDSQSGSRFLLGVLFTIAELLLFASVLLWLYWAYQHDDGLAWQSDRKQQFNTHAALMLFGFIFLSGQAMLIHRSFSCCSKIYTKILHTILFVLATSAISLGLILAYTAQENVGANNKPIMHFYSLHAWCGLTTVALFALQFVFGFVSFLILLCCDQATAGYRAALLPIHKTFGLIIFSLAVATCLTGLLQTARSRLSSKLNKTDYHELAEPGIVINLIGVCLICLAILMPYIIRNLDIKRATTFRSQLDRHLNKLSQLDMRI